jgi:hypothetical protein
LEQHEKIGEKKENKNTDHMSLRISPEIKMKKQRNEELHLFHPTTFPDSSGKRRRRRILHEFCCKNQSSISLSRKTSSELRMAWRSRFKQKLCT